MFRLRIEGGPRSGEAISLAPGKTLVMGRGRECDIRFPEDATMSRVQADLTWDGSAWTINNKSQHGTLVAGQRVDTSKVLTPNDTLVLGGTHLVFEVDPSGSPTLAPRPQPAGTPPTAGGTGNTPPPMSRDVAKPAAAGAPATPAAAGATPAGKPAKPAAAKKGGGGNGTKIVIGLVIFLFLCCCFSGIFWKFVLPWIQAHRH